MPYIRLDETSDIHFGGLRLVSAAVLLPQIQDRVLAGRVKDLLEMHREGSRTAGKGRPLTGIGVIVIGAPDFRFFNNRDLQRIRDFRTVLFLCCLASNNRQRGPNAGHDTYTSENFDTIYQGFVLDQDWIAETTGVLVRVTNMGFRISETQYPKPTHVIRPLSFRMDGRLLFLLNWLRRYNTKSYARILRAASVFLESFYNAENVDIRARILLQASSFEILLDLPEGKARQAFKTWCELLTNTTDERRFRYQFESRKKVLRNGSASVKGIWADRFFTLRNHIIHGDALRPSEYRFRRAQRHLLIAPMFFIIAVERLIDVARLQRGLSQECDDKLIWTVIEKGDEFDPRRIGFMVSDDAMRRFLRQSA